MLFYFPYLVICFVFLTSKVYCISIACFLYGYQFYLYLFMLHIFLVHVIISFNGAVQHQGGPQWPSG